MSAEQVRIGWMQLFTQMRAPNSFLTSFFKMRPGNAYNGKKVTIDVERFGEDVAVVVKECTGPNLNDVSTYTTKEFIPPAYGEAIVMDVCDLLNRMAGVDPYTAAYTEYAAQLTSMMAKNFRLIDHKIVRGVELQASQILQTGILDLKDKNGDTVYTLDFKPKATHFPTAGTSWSDTANADPIADLEALAEVIRADGKVDPDLLVMGRSAVNNFINNEKVQPLLDNRRINIGEIAPRQAGLGATFHGTVWAGQYEFQIWSYKDTYKDPQTGNPTKYVADDSVIMLSSSTRLDITSAKVPLPLGPDPRVASLLPGRMTDRDAGFDVTPNVYPTPNGKQIMAELESRPLLVPVQIDGFGCLDTEV